MKNRVKDASIFITGANGGIAVETVKLLIKGGAKRIVLACRTIEKAEMTRTKLLSEQKTTTVLEAVGGFDMTKQGEIEQAVKRLSADNPFDIVFLQAGGMIVSKDFQFIETPNGKVEKTIFQNVFGGYISLKALEEAGLLSKGARIVFAGGEGARGIPGLIPKPQFNTVEEYMSYLRRGRGKYVDLHALGVSKFTSALLVQKLACLNDGRSYVWFSPGLTSRTNGLQHVHNPKRFLLERIGFPFMELIGIAQGPKAAAQKYYDALNGSYGENGDLIGAPEGKAVGKLVDQKPMNLALTNHALRDALFDFVKSNISPDPNVSARN